MPINRENLIPYRAGGTPNRKNLVEYKIGGTPDRKNLEQTSFFHGVGEAYNTLKNVGKVYPAFENAANIASSMYGVPISGMVGLAMLPFGLDKANAALEATQKFLVYQPQTQGGQELYSAVNYPIEKLSKDVAEPVGDAFDRAGMPNAAAGVKTAIEASPLLLGIRKSGMSPKKYTAKTNKALDKAVRPSVVNKEMFYQRKQYMKNAVTAVNEITKNKGNLLLTDEYGNTVRHLPKTLEQFSQSIEQTKKTIFDEYNSLAKSAGENGAAVNAGPIIKELSSLMNDNVLASFSPETIKYAQQRIAGLMKSDQNGNPIGAKTFTPQEAQMAIKMMNESEKAYYAAPSPASKGRMYVDALIANNLRSGLDAAIEGATGAKYQPLKNRYGALRMLETDVTKRAIVDARKNNKGLADLTDVFSGYHLMQGILSQQPVTIAAGIASKGIAGYFKFKNNPNRIVTKMFKRSEKYNYTPPKYPKRKYVGASVGATMGKIGDENED